MKEWFRDSINQYRYEEFFQKSEINPYTYDGINDNMYAWIMCLAATCGNNDIAGAFVNHMVRYIGVINYSELDIVPILTEFSRGFYTAKYEEKHRERLDMVLLKEKGLGITKTLDLINSLEERDLVITEYGEHLTSEKKKNEDFRFD